MRLNVTMALVGTRSLTKAGTPWIGVEIKAHVVLWHLTSDVHGDIYIFSF